MEQIDINHVREEWEKRGFSCDIWVDPPGQVWADFVHETDELVMVLEGTLEIEMQGKTLQPDKGEEVFIPARVYHTVRNIGPNTARWLYGYKK